MRVLFFLFLKIKLWELLRTAWLNISMPFQWHQHINEGSFDIVFDFIKQLFPLKTIENNYWFNKGYARGLAKLIYQKKKLKKLEVRWLFHVLLGLPVSFRTGCLLVINHHILNTHGKDGDSNQQRSKEVDIYPRDHRAPHKWNFCNL